MKRGFTLVEMIAVILIMTLISIAVIPSILNLVNNKKAEISDTILEIIKTSVKNYLHNKNITYPSIPGNTYCIILSEVVESGELSSSLKDIKTGNEIALTSVMKVQINEFSDFELCMVGINDCSSCTEYRK